MDRDHDLLINRQVSIFFFWVNKLLKFQALVNAEHDFKKKLQSHKR